MRPFFKPLHLPSVAALMCLPAFAAEAAGDAERLLSYMNNQAFSKRLYEAAVTTDAFRRYRCGRGQYVVRFTGKYLELSPVVMPSGAAHPESGSWQVQFDVTRCDETKTYNAIFSSRPGLPPRMMPTHPGTTRVSRQLFADMSVGLLAKAAVTAGKDKCSKFRVIDTQFIDEKRDVTVKGVHFISFSRERWTIDVCWQPVEAIVEFVQRTGVPGTSIVIKDTRKLPVTVKPPGAVAKDGTRTVLVSLNEMLDLLNRIQAGDTQEPVKIIKKKAAQNYEQYQYLLATLYIQGKGVPKDISGSAYWAMRAANEGHGRAMDLIGAIYEGGYWVIQDFDVAEQWYQKAVKQGEHVSTKSLRRLEMKRALLARAKNNSPRTPVSTAKPKSKGLFDFLKPSSSPPTNENDTKDRP